MSNRFDTYWRGSSEIPAELSAHPLKGELAGYGASPCPPTWRIIFRFEENDATDVDLVDYHWRKRTHTMSMKNPPHPGLSVRRDCSEPVGLTITETAELLGVSRQTLNNLLNGKSGVSADMAIRLEEAFGGDAATWLRLRLQMAYDLAQARQHEGEIKVNPVARRKLHEPRP
jgi:addiction module HigA family antidote